MLRDEAPPYLHRPRLEGELPAAVGEHVGEDDRHGPEGQVAHAGLARAHRAARAVVEAEVDRAREPAPELVEAAQPGVRGEGGAAGEQRRGLGADGRRPAGAVRLPLPL